MHVELNEEELQAYSIILKGEIRMDINNPFHGKTKEYTKERVNEICEKFKKKYNYDYNVFENIMKCFFFCNKSLSVIEDCVYSLMVLYSDYGVCAKHYNKDNNIYEFWNIENNEEINKMFLDYLKIDNISCNKKFRHIYDKKEFDKKIKSKKLNEIEKKDEIIFNNCGYELILEYQGELYNYNLDMETYFNITNDGIEYSKLYYLEEQLILEIGIIDAKDLLDVAFNQTNPDPEKYNGDNIRKTTKKGKNKNYLTIIIAIVIALLFYIAYMVANFNSIEKYNRICNNENNKCIGYISKIDRNYSISTLSRHDKEVYVTYKIDENTYDVLLGEFSSSKELNTGDQLEIYYNPNNYNEITSKEVVNEAVYNIIIVLLFALWPILIVIVSLITKSDKITLFFTYMLTILISIYSSLHWHDPTNTILTTIFSTIIMIIIYVLIKNNYKADYLKIKDDKK